METANNKDQNHCFKNSIRRTPRQLIKHHMEHPEEPIRHEDIENLIIGSDAVGHNPIKEWQIMERIDTIFSQN